MTKNQLENLRLVTPGLIILFVFYSTSIVRFSINDFLKSIDIKSSGGYFLLSLVLGGLYVLLGVRDIILLRSQWRYIEDNIKDRLVAMLPEYLQNDSRWEQVKQNRALIDVFYNVVDNDASLKTRGDGVYQNGAFISTTADVTIIFFCGAIVHASLNYKTQQMHYWEWAVVYSTVALFTWLAILPIAIHRHKRLSNEQLDYMVIHHKLQVQTKLQELLHALPPTDISEESENH